MKFEYYCNLICALLFIIFNDGVGQQWPAGTSRPRRSSAAIPNNSPKQFQQQQQTSEVFSGEFTYYEQIGTGACGTQLMEGKFSVAVGINHFNKKIGNPNNDPVCKKCVCVTYKGKSTYAEVHDKCVSCGLANLDLSLVAFEKLAHKDLGRGNTTQWKFIDCAKKDQCSAKYISGEFTFYEQIGSGACGTQLVEGKFSVAVGIDHFDKKIGNPNNDPVCKKCVCVAYKGKTTYAEVRDKCVSCGLVSLDLSLVAFEKLAHKDLGRGNATQWKFIDCEKKEQCSIQYISG